MFVTAVCVLFPISPSSENRQHYIALQRYYKSLYGNITIVQLVRNKGEK